MIFVLRFIVLWILSVGPALAQDGSQPDPCAYNREVISVLSGPHFSYPSVWEAPYLRKDKLTQLYVSIPDDGGTVWAMGRTIDRKTFQPSDIVIVQLDRRGRALTESFTKAKEGELPVAMMKQGEGFVVLSDIRDAKTGAARKARLAWYDKKGKFRSEKVFSDPSHSLEATALSPAAGDKSGMMVVLHAKKGADEYSMVMRLTSGGAVIWQRTYQPGPPNMLMDIVAGEDGNYLALGRIRSDDGRPAGWLLSLASDGTVRWERTYARGAFSIFRKGVAVPGGHALAGESKPSGGDDPAALWVMAVNEEGEPSWQRFYTRKDMAFSGAGLLTWTDGRLTVMANAKAVTGAKERSHVRLLELSPMGVMLGDEAYIKGVQGRAYSLTTAWNEERVVTGSFDAGANAPKESPRFQGWVFVATAPSSYDNPCVKP